MASDAEFVLFETFTVAIPISENLTRLFEPKAPTDQAVLPLAREHARETGVSTSEEPWIVKHGRRPD